MCSVEGVFQAAAAVGELVEVLGAGISAAVVGE